MPHPDPVERQGFVTEKEAESEKCNSMLVEEEMMAGDQTINISQFRSKVQA